MSERNIRIIPRLDIKGSNLVKGIHLEGLKILGTPSTFSKYYYTSGADELLYVDAVASLYGRNSLYDVIKNTVKEIFIPLTVGGGLRSLDDISDVLLCGADKVVINTEAIIRPEFISQAAKKFGSSTIMVEIQTKKQINGDYLAFTDNGRNNSGIDAIEWAGQVEKHGAGELLVTSVDNDGTGGGFDVDVIKKISESVSIPVIATGGAGSIVHIIDLIENTEINGVGLASMLHYPLVQKLIKTGHQFGKVGEFNVIQESYTNNRINGSDIKTIKSSIISSGLNTRTIYDS